MFDVFEELAAPEFDIPFDMEASFTGSRDDLFEYDAEMWSQCFALAAQIVDANPDYRRRIPSTAPPHLIPIQTFPLPIVVRVKIVLRNPNARVSVQPVYEASP